MPQKEKSLIVRNQRNLIEKKTFKKRNLPEKFKKQLQQKCN